MVSLIASTITLSILTGPATSWWKSRATAEKKLSLDQGNLLNGIDNKTEHMISALAYRKSLNLKIEQKHFIFSNQLKNI